MEGKDYYIDKAEGSKIWRDKVNTGRSGGNWYGLASCSAVWTIHSA